MKGNFKLKKAEDKRDEKIEKAKEENKTFVEFDNAGPTAARAGADEMGVCEQETGCQPHEIEEAAHEEVLGRQRRKLRRGGGLVTRHYETFTVLIRLFSKEFLGYRSARCSCHNYLGLLDFCFAQYMWQRPYFGTITRN